MANFIPYNELENKRTVFIKSDDFIEIKKGIENSGNNSLNKYLLVYKLLELLMENVSCDEYAFIIFETDIQQMFSQSILNEMQDIVKNYFLSKYNEEKDTDTISSYKKIAFSAFYYSALVYYRNFNNDAFKELLLWKIDDVYVYKVFGDVFALTYDLFNRLAIRESKYYETIAMSNIINEKLNLSSSFKNKEGGSFNLAIQNAIIEATVNLAYEKVITNTFFDALSNDNKVNTKNEPIDIDEIALSLLNLNNDSKDKNKDMEEKIIDSGVHFKKLMDELLEKSNKVLDCNNKYPKYHYLNAQAIFYTGLMKNRVVKRETIKAVSKELKEAVNLIGENNKDAKSLKEQYDSFLNFVKLFAKEDKDFYSKALGIQADKFNICKGTNKQNRPVVEIPKDTPHIFISYSSQNFRQVYCDILELTHAGIYCDYDGELDITQKLLSSDRYKQEWFRAVEQKIDDADIIVCYLSEDYFNSYPSLLELQLANKLEKPVVGIGLDNKCCVTKTIISAINNGMIITNYYSTEYLEVCSKLFSKDKDIIPRDVNPLFTLHIKSLVNRLHRINKNIIHNIYISGESRINKNISTGELVHIGEDSIAFDNFYKLGIVSDGVTRITKTKSGVKINNQEYEKYGTSISKEVSLAFTTCMERNIKMALDELDRISQLDSIIKDAFISANQEVKKLVLSFNNDNSIQKLYKDKFMEIPGTCSIVAFVYKNTLYYGYIGDCFGLITRNENKIVFAEQQTTGAFKIKQEEKNRETLQKEYVNNKDNVYGYGIVNGDEKAAYYFKTGSIELQPNDVVYIMSDGVGDYIQDMPVSSFNSLSVSEIIDNSEKYDIKIGKKNFDDRSLVKIEYSSKPQAKLLK